MVKPDRGSTDLILQRIGAQLIDNFLIGGLSFAALLISGVAGVGLGGAESELATAAVGVGLVLFMLIVLGYNFFLEAFWNGQTVGKRLLSIKVVKEEGAEIDKAAALIRNIPALMALSGLSIIIYPLGYVAALISMGVSDRRQRLFDRLAGTVVVREDF